MEYKNYRSFVGSLEEGITEAIRANTARSWDENNISFDLVTKLRSTLSGAVIRGVERSFAISCEIFKAGRPLEDRHGDIALLVAFRSWDGATVEGIGFLEAKRRYKASGAYDAISQPQLKRIHGASPHAQLLLYSHESVAEFGDNLRALSPGKWTHSPLYHGSVSHGLTLPLGTAVALNDKGTTLHRFAIPFSLQLAGRYLRGFDLDFRNEVKERVTRYARERIDDYPSFVITVGVDVGSDEPGVEPGIEIADVYDAITPE